MQRQAGWQAQLGPQAQPVEAAAAAANWVAGDWQPQVQDAPGQLAQLQAEGVVVVGMEAP
jgi:hypothetical protein